MYIFSFLLFSPFNSAEAIEKAKRVVDEHYAVVGVLEDMNTTLTVLEHYIPKFFKGAIEIYYSKCIFILLIPFILISSAF